MEAGFNEWHPFRKENDEFGYQNEFRITFVNDNRDVYMLDLGCSLRDIAVPIMAGDVNQIHFEGEKLLYPKYREKWYLKLNRLLKRRKRSRIYH